jgi:hypothetical protein
MDASLARIIADNDVVVISILKLLTAGNAEAALDAVGAILLNVLSKGGEVPGGGRDGELILHVLSAIWSFFFAHLNSHDDFGKGKKGKAYVVAPVDSRVVGARDSITVTPASSNVEVSVEADQVTNTIIDRSGLSEVPYKKRSPLANV